MIYTNDGGFLLGGGTTSFGSEGSDIWLVKTDATGEVDWSRTYGGASDDGLYALIQTDDGGYALGGWTGSFGVGNRDFWLIKTDSAGNVEWNETYGGSAYEYPWAIVQTVDGGYALAGWTGYFGAGQRDLWLVKTNSTGYMQWNKTYGGTGDDQAAGLAQTADEGYVIGGYTGSFGEGSRDFWLIKTDSSGDLEWAETYGGAGDDYAWSMVGTDDGGYAMAGYTCSSGVGGSDIWLVKADSGGYLEWNRTYGTTDNEEARDLAQTADGGYILAGWTDSFCTGGMDWWLVKVDSNGDKQWNRTYGEGFDETAHSIVETSIGKYAILGRCQISGDPYDDDFWLIKLEHVPPLVEDTEAYVGYINETITDLPDELFSRSEEDIPEVQEDFSDLLDDALENINEENYDFAKEKLNRIKENIYTELIESPERQEIISLIDDLIAYVESL